jgi:hypothetical protein
MSARERQRRAKEAAKKQRQRDRERAGSGFLSVPLRDINGSTELVQALGWIGWDESENKEEVGKAVGLGIDEMTVAWRRAGCPRGTDMLAKFWHNRDHD